MSTNRRSSSSFGTYADGIVLRDMPILGMYPGDTYWVDSNGGGSDKGSFSSPVATLAEGLALCRADNSDMVMIKPNHSETITGAGGITMAKAGVSVVGMGRYDARPTFLMDGATTVTMLVTAANCSVYNCKFLAGHQSIVTFCTISAKGCRFESCMFEANTTSETFVSIFNTSAVANQCDGLALINNTLNFGTETDVLLPINLLETSKDVKIIGNTIIGDMDTSTYQAIYSVATLNHYNIEVAYNKIFTHHDQNNIICITVGGTSSTGFIHNNIAKGEDDADATPFLGAADGLGMFKNLWVGDATKSGFVYPAIGAV